MAEQIPTPEASKLEWGPELDLMSWVTAVIKIDELNKDLSKEEKPWRLPTSDELQAEVGKTDSIPTGFQGDFYLSDTTKGDSVCVVNMDGGYMTYKRKGDQVRVRLVR